MLYFWASKKKIMMKLNALALFLIAAMLFTGCQKDSSSTEESTDNATEEVATADQKAPEANQAADNAAPSIPLTSVEWEVKTHDFGEIPKGEKQKYIFEFTNTGDNPLVISSATAGCGCTVPKKPEEPIAPGDKGEIEVEYNGSGNGKISKNVTVLLNTDGGKEILNITANVVDPNAPAE
jgi:hypothetical protein